MQQLSLWSSTPAEAPSAPAGLIVHRASRTERLAERLAQELERIRPANPLEPQRVVIAHAGLRRWLLGEFARREPAGKRGIAANIETMLPWQWLQRTAERVLGDAQLIGGEWRRESLRWHVFAALAEPDDARVAAYLRDDLDARRRFALAERLAGTFEQYLIYRAEWILEWERGASRDWQARLWQRVRAAIDTPHRARRGAALCAALAREGDGESLPLHVFGVSHLAPDVLAALRAVAARRLVNVYFPDPCREHWVYFRKERTQLVAAPERAAYYEIGHPLLAGLGRIGQDFCLALEEAEAQEWRDPLDDAEPGHRVPLLGQVQWSVRCAAPEMLGAETRAAASNVSRGEPPEQRIAEKTLQDELIAMRADASLRIHACHTRLRELEVLRDALLGFLADDDTLSHADIVVMAPDISLYAPSLAAVFGEAARHATDPAHLPWHVADVTLARSHPVIDAFLRMLDLRESRFTVSEVIDFLDVAALARRFGVDEQARTRIEHALRRARVAWGLDAPMKAQAGGAAIAANSWRFGFDRLYAGYLSGGEVTQALDDVLPLEGIDDSAAEALARMDELLEALRVTRDGLAQPRTLQQWNAWLRQRLDALLRADPRDEAESIALATLQRTVGALADQAAAAGADTSLSWQVVRDVIRAAVDTVAERQPFLHGGVTFCGLVPQRSIPFRVVCVLGMNEGEFPRAVGDAELNRVVEAPRRGDRDARNEDRYLFLEALMAARERLHISYIGTEAAAGKTLNPAAPLADLLQLLDEQHGLAGADEIDRPRPWLVRHPLQPFDARYYVQANERTNDGETRNDPRLFSFTRIFAQTPPSGAGASAVFLDPGAGTPSVAPDESVSIAALKRFWRDPAKAILRDEAGIGLDALSDDEWLDREPLDAKTDRRERVERRLLLDALQSGQPVPELPPPWLARSGMLAAGDAGRRAYAGVRDCARAALDALPDELGRQAPLAAQSVELALDGGERLSGRIESVFRGADARLWRFDARLTRAADFSDLIPLYIDWAALRLGVAPDVALCFLEKTNHKEGSSLKIAQPAVLDAIRAQDDAQLARGLHRLIALRAEALARPIVFPPKTAWAWLCAGPAERESAARIAWNGDGYAARGESGFSDSYAAVLARDLDFLAVGTPAHAGFAATVHAVAGVLDPERRVLAIGAPDAGHD